jgi:hypothetical protein
MGALYFIRSNGLKIIGTKQEELKLLTGTKKNVDPELVSN